MTEIDLHKFNDVAVKYQIQPRTIYETCRKKQIPYVIIGNDRFFTDDGLQMFIDACTRTPTNRTYNDAKLDES